VKIGCPFHNINLLRCKKIQRGLKNCKFFWEQCKHMQKCSKIVLATLLTFILSRQIQSPKSGAAGRMPALCIVTAVKKQILFVKRTFLVGTDWNQVFSVLYF
jgi:hypothetical protein